MNVLVTGAEGFIGKNLVVALERAGGISVSGFDLSSEPHMLEHELVHCDFVFHLAGVNRPEKVEEFVSGNVELTARMCSILRSAGRKPGILLASSTQAALGNPYGISKKRAEDEILKFAEKSGAEVFVFRLPGVFGKWSRPNYNSVVATFCHNIARELPIVVSDPDKELDLVYIDDVVAAFLGVMIGNVRRDCEGFCRVEPTFKPKLDELAGLITSFHASRFSHILPDFSDRLTKCLYATYLSFVPAEGLRHPLDNKADQRGSLAEILKSPHSGQVFVSRTRPGVTRGKHYHDTKVEKFVVLEGEAAIRLRDIQGNHVTEILVSGDKPEIINVPPGYTHSIENTGKGDLITLFWANEMFDPNSPDTYFAEVTNEKN